MCPAAPPRSRLLSLRPLHRGLLGAAEHQTIRSVSGPGVPPGSGAFWVDVGGGRLLLQLLQLPHGPQVRHIHLPKSTPRAFVPLFPLFSSLFTAITWRLERGMWCPSAAALSTDTDTHWLCMRYLFCTSTQSLAACLRNSSTCAQFLQVLPDDAESSYSDVLRTAARLKELTDFFESLLLSAF